MGRIKPLLILVILVVVVLLLTPASLSLASSPPIVAGGISEPKEVMQIIETNSVFRRALEAALGVENPDDNILDNIIKEIKIREITAPVEANTFSINANGEVSPSSSPTSLIQEGERVIAVDTPYGRVLIKKSCGNPQVPPPLPLPPPEAEVVVQKKCGPSPDGPWNLCAGFTFRVEAKNVPWKTNTGWWESWGVNTNDHPLIFKIPGELFGQNPTIELTISEDPKDWKPKDSPWKTIEIRPGEVEVVTFFNWKPSPEQPEPSPPPPETPVLPPEPTTPPGPPPGPTPEPPPPGPTKEPTPQPPPSELTPEPPPGPPPGPTPEPPPGPTPGPPPEPPPGPPPEPPPPPQPTTSPEPTKNNNGVGQEKRGLDDGQPAGISDKAGLDNDRVGRNPETGNPGTPTGENQSKGGNRGETPGKGGKKK